jgi:hypothetical protein
MKSDFYVYVYFRPDTGQPCYIGKGRGRRWQAHNKHRSTNPRLRNIIKKYGELPCTKIRVGLTEGEAFATETAFIKAIGRGKNGPLVNLTDGGEGSSGFVPTAEMRAKQSARSRSPERMAALLKQNRSPEHIARLLVLARCPKRRAKFSEFARSPENIARLAAMNRSPETRARRSALSSRPEVIARLRQNSSSPGWRARRSAMSRNPDHLARLLEHNKSIEHRAQVAERNRTPEMRAAASARAAKRNSSPEFQAKTAEGLRRYHEARRAAKAEADLVSENMGATRAGHRSRRARAAKGQ